MIVERTPQEVIDYCRSTLGVGAESKGIDDVLLTGLLRRCAGILCPCSRTALRASLMDSLSYLHSDNSALAERLDQLVDDMIVVGDLLELSDVATDDLEVKGTWVFAAPPAFVVRKSGSVFLTGIVPDQDSMLNASLEARVVYSGAIRFMLPVDGEDLAEALTEQGLHQLSESIWLRSPKIQRAEQLLDSLEQHLAREPVCGPVNGLEILDPSTKVMYYRGRWCEPRSQTGKFVARRPQEFGAPIWCFVKLAEGSARRVIDLPPRNYRWRGCDAAWHLQMAVDDQRGEPQRYRRSSTDNGIRFDFFSPLPLWAQRRLMVLERECVHERSRLAYELPAAEADEEEMYLQQYLWLKPADEKNGRGEN